LEGENAPVEMHSGVRKASYPAFPDSGRGNFSLSAGRLHSHGHFLRAPGRPPLLYFAYESDIDPEVMAKRCAVFRFRFVAHLPEHKLVFPLVSESWGGGVASVEPTQGETVWGVIYEVPDAQAKALDKLQAAEGRETRTRVEVMDREGKRHQAVTYRAKDNSPRHKPSKRFIQTVVGGSRKWELPAGWIAGVEELTEL